MNRVGILLCLVVLILVGCTAPPASTSNPVPVGVTPTGGGDTAETPSQHKISLAVGHAVDGGWYQLFFTDPADPAAGQLSGGADEQLAAAIDAAQLSVDVAVYSFSLRSVRKALLDAQRRGVNVRIVMESDNMDANEPQALKDAGVPILGDRNEGLMHDKFVVIDRSEVWTGSMNLTGDGAYDDRNNLIRIRSSKVASDYTAEFEEMFTDDKFGKNVGGPTPYPHVTVNGVPLDIYFSPDDHVQKALVDLLDNAQSSIYFLAYSFTADPLAEAIRDRAKAGVKVQGVMDADQMVTNMGTEYDGFRAAGLDVRLDGESGLMHNKVLVIDNQIVVLGSYNFTASAEKYNDENVVVIHSPEIAAEYLKEFRRVYAAAQP